DGGGWPAVAPPLAARSGPPGDRIPPVGPRPMATPGAGPATPRPPGRIVEVVTPPAAVAGTVLPPGRVGGVGEAVAPASELDGAASWPATGLAPSDDGAVIGTEAVGTRRT